jgi:hypothetical protein
MICGGRTGVEVVGMLMEKRRGEGRIEEKLGSHACAMLLGFREVAMLCGRKGH